ncbi:MAG: sulfatase [Phycisphaeraceae bacterium]
MPGVHTLSASDGSDGNDRNGDPPNIVLIYTDDMGFGELSSYNAEDLRTPRLDQMADEGVRFTNFYNSSSACSTSRGALLTGSYHQRLSVRTVFSPQSDRGLNPDEITLGDMLSEAGFTTAAIGKWHLGNAPNLRPNAQGFDLFYGIPVSHDYNYPDGKGMPFYENERIIDRQIPDELYTQRLTDRAITFIEDNRDDPFFVYLAYPMPHVPLAVTDRFKDRSQRGLYGDVMEELDHNVGRILDTLEEHDLDDNTIVLFLSDNGPWGSYGNHAGLTGGLRGGKRNTFEGGVRTPMIAWGPGHVRSGVVEDAPAMTIDLFPTFAHLAGGQIPDDRVVDGIDIRSLLLDGRYPSVDPNRPLMFYDYSSNRLFSMRMGPWKLHFPHRHQIVDREGHDGKRGSYRWENIGLSLYNLDDDPPETENLAGAHPEVVNQMQQIADQYRNDLGDALQDISPGPNVRPLGTAE